MRTMASSCFSSSGLPEYIIFIFSRMPALSVAIFSVFCKDERTTFAQHFA